MFNSLLYIAAYFILVMVLAFISVFLLKSSNVFVYISSNQFGVLQKVWSRKGSVKTGLIALNGEAGFQPGILRTGPHFFMPWLYRVHKQKLITVRTMAYVYARDGYPLPAGQTLAKTPDGVNFEDMRGFLAAGGQRGMQRMVLREGVYAINTAGLVVFTEDGAHAIDIGDDADTLTSLHNEIQKREGFSPVVLRGHEDSVGVVTVHDGPALSGDEIIAPTIGSSSQSHNSFQDIEAFLALGGRRGRQEQVITEGTFFINRLFATVEILEKTIVPVGTVGVVVSFIGPRGQDMSGDAYKHGELVANGFRGVLAEPLRPGKYAINPYARTIISVPTTNFVLRWIAGRVEDHGFDRGLSEISLITSDAFQPRLPLSIVVHIAPDKAPRVIQRFAEINKLVDQTIDPMVSAFFKDAAQKTSMLKLVQNRDELQKDAKAAMQTRFADYDLDLLEVMIGTPQANEGDTAIAALFDQLRARQVADEQKVTFAAQQSAAEAGKKLNEANAKASMQTKITQAEAEATIAAQEGIATLNRRQKEAEALQAVGQAEAAVIRAKVEAFTGEGADRQLQQVIVEQLAQAIIKSPNAIVPNVLVSGGANGEKGGASPMDALLTMLVARENRDAKH